MPNSSSPFRTISKQLAVTLITASLFLLTACSPKKPAGQAGKDGKPIVLKLAHVGPEDHPANKAAQDLVKEIARQTKGRVKIELYPNAKLGNEKELVEGCLGGNIELVAVTTTELAKIAPEFMVFDLPFFFESEKDAYHILDNIVGEDLKKILPEKGLIGLAYYENGYRHLTNRDKAIRSPKDMRGLKIRAQDSPIYVDMFKEMGASPVTIDFTESWQALKEGVADGADGSLPIIYYNRWFEANHYLTLTRHTYQPMIVVANKEIWESIPEDLRKILEKEFSEFTPEMRSVLARYNDRTIVKLKERGMTIVELTKAERAEFNKVTAKVVAKYLDVIGKERVDKVKESLAELHAQEN